MPRSLVIAIDGPAASGKSTTARLVAERLGYLYVDTGAMYRAVTLKIIRAGLSVDDEDAIAPLMETTQVALRRTEGGLTVVLDGEEVTEAIRTPEVTRAVSAVSSLKPVRAAMVREQRRMGASGGIVLEGRDIGTVVFPDADLKFFMVAGIDARARRRLQELLDRGIQVRQEDLEREIRERDHRDSTRKESPLRKAEDAIVVDTSGLTIDQQVGVVVKAVEEKLRAEANT